LGGPPQPDSTPSSSVVSQRRGRLLEGVSTIGSAPTSTDSTDPWNVHAVAQMFNSSPSTNRGQAVYGAKNHQWGLDAGMLGSSDSADGWAGQGIPGKAVEAEPWFEPRRTSIIPPAPTDTRKYHVPAQFSPKNNRINHNQPPQLRNSHSRQLSESSLSPDENYQPAGEPEEDKEPGKVKRNIWKMNKASAMTAPSRNDSGVTANITGTSNWGTSKRPIQLTDAALDARESDMLQTAAAKSTVPSVGRTPTAKPAWQPLLRRTSSTDLPASPAQIRRNSSSSKEDTGVKKERKGFMRFFGGGSSNALQKEVCV
jgi:hypothetical protein